MVSAPSLTAEEKARILQALREDPAFREELRRLLLEELQAAMQNLQQATQDTHETLDRLARLVREGFEAIHEAIHALRLQVQENSRQIQENARQIAALTEHMDRVEVQIAKLTGEIREQRIRLDDVSGVSAEAGAREDIDVWLRSRGVEVVHKYLPGDLQDRLGVRSLPDGVMLVRRDTGYVFLVYEVTFTIALRDVERIADWLAGFRKVKWPAIGLVHFRRALPEEDVEHYISENGREVIHTVPGMRTVRAKAAQGGVLLMQHGASPWTPEGWRPPEGLKEVPQVLPSTSNWV